MPTPPSSAYPPGTTLTVGSHDVVTEQFIGEGGFAHVYTVRATPAVPGQEIACLKRVQVPNKAYLNLLRAEVEAMQRLKGSSNIVEYYDSHAERMKDTPGQYEVFLLMEYCSRGGLIDFMNTRLRDQLREHEILKIMYDITLGVAHMHYLSPALLHRDLKIENVLIRGDGTYMLCDFGSASPVLRPPKNAGEFRILEDDIQHHTTVQYRSPEMIDLSLGHPIDEKSDIWALGIFLYKLCYYTTPFERPNQTLEQFQALILTASYTIPPRPAYSERLRNMIRILLQPDPRLRPNVFQVMQEVCAMRHVDCPIQDIYSRPRPVAQPLAMPGLQMVPGPAGAATAAPAPGAPLSAPSPAIIPMQAVPAAAGGPQAPIQLPPQSLSVPAGAAAGLLRPLQLPAGSEPISPVSTGSQEPAMYETEDELAARYPSVEEIDRTMSFSSAKIPRRKSTDLAGESSSSNTSGRLSGRSSIAGAPESGMPAAAAAAAGPSTPTAAATAAGGGSLVVGVGAGPGKRGSVPLIDLDSPPSKPVRPAQRDSLLPPARSDKPVKPAKPARPAVKSAPATEYPMPTRPARSRQVSPAMYGGESGGTSSGESATESDGVEAVPESRMTSEATKLKQILTGIGDRPSTVIMDKPEDSRNMSSVDFLRTLGNDGPGAHSHLHMHSRSRKHSLFYNSASASTSRLKQADKEAEEDDDYDDDEDYGYGGTNVRVGGSQRSEPEGRAYGSSDEDLSEYDDDRFDFTDSAPATPLASPSKIVPAQAPGTEARQKPAKPAKPSVKPAIKSAAKPVHVSSHSVRPVVDIPGRHDHGGAHAHALHPVVDIPGQHEHGGGGHTMHPVVDIPGKHTHAPGGHTMHPVVDIPGKHTHAPGGHTMHPVVDIPGKHTHAPGGHSMHPVVDIPGKHTHAPGGHTMHPVVDIPGKHSHGGGSHAHAVHAKIELPGIHAQMGTHGHGVHPVVEVPGKAAKPLHIGSSKPRPKSVVVSHSTTELGSFQPSNSIQQRVRALLSGQDRQHPPVRTARGYGRFTDTLDDELKPAARSRSMGSEVREVRELREMAPAVPSRESKPKPQLSRSLSTQSLKHK